AEMDLEQAVRRSPRLVVAMGAGALTALKNHRVAVPILGTMVLRADAAGLISPGQKTAAVYLDVPIAEVLARVRAIFPGKTRMGMIRNPARDSGDRASTAIEAH